MDLINKIKKLIGIDVDTEPLASTHNETANTKRPPSIFPPAPEKRDEMVRFIIHSLHPYIDEKNTSIRGIKLYILCESIDEDELARVALYHDKPGKFRQDELQRKLSDNYIQLPDNWFFEFTLVKDRLPACRFIQGNLGLDIIDGSKHSGHYLVAKLQALEGQTSEAEYILDPSRKAKYFIGRGRTPVLESGKTHTNDIIFFDKSEKEFNEQFGASNLFVSRNHAYISYDFKENKYFLFVDKGGLPSNGNKTKLLKSEESDKVERLDIMGAAHELSDGDQIVLGGEAKLLFRISEFF